MSPEQCRAARAWLKLSMEDLAGSANVEIVSVRDFEAKRLSRLSPAATAMQAALERRGVFFLEEEGLIVPKPQKPKKTKPEAEDAPAFPKARHGLRF